MSRRSVSEGGPAIRNGFRAPRPGRGPDRRGPQAAGTGALRGSKEVQFFGPGALGKHSAKGDHGGNLLPPLLLDDLLIRATRS